MCVETGSSASTTGDSMALSNVAQFAVLLWKNYLLQKRRLLNTMSYIATPPVCALLLLLMRMKSDAKFQPSPTIYESFEASTSFPSNLTFPTSNHVSTSVTRNTSNLSNWTLVFSPSASKAAIRMIEGTARMLHAVRIGISFCLCDSFLGRIADAACCYRPSSVVGLSVCLLVCLSHQ